MRASVAIVIVLAVLSLAGCGASPQGSGSPPPTPTIGAQPSPTPPTPSGSAGAFTVCRTVETPVCPLEPRNYFVAVHDSFSFSISDAGWQEERAVVGALETRVILSRVDDPAQRLTFLSGNTGAAGRVLLNPAAFNIPEFTAGPPTAITIAGTPAQYIELEPSGAPGASSVTIEGQRIGLEPDRRYRFTLGRIPMDQESATVIMVTEAPVADFATFVSIADRVLQTVKF